MVSKTFQGDYGAAVAPADSSPQLATWLTEAAASDGSTLTIEPGSYHWASTNGPTHGLTNATINGYGASVDALFIGNAGLIQESYAQSARIQTVAAGATSVTVTGSNDGSLIGAADITLFSNGDWILICGLGLQTAQSYPPNFQWNEFRKITGIAGNVISFAEPLANTYRATWPYIDAQPCTINIGTSTFTCATVTTIEGNPTVITTNGTLPTGITAGSVYYIKNRSGSTFQLSATAFGAAISLSGTQSGTHYHHHETTPDLAGPATIYRMLPRFDGTQSYSGLRCTSSGANFMGGGKSLTVNDMYFDGLGPAPSAGKSIIINNSQIGGQNEVDKCVEYLEYNNCTGIHITTPIDVTAQLLFFSPLGGQLVIRNCNLTTLNGSARITEIIGGSFNEVVYVPLSYGHAELIRATNCAIASSRSAGVVGLDPTVFTAFASGTFTVPNAVAGEVWQFAVPGLIYVFGRDQSSIPDSGPRVTFIITDVRQDTTNTYVDTTIIGALPTPTFGGQPANVYMRELTLLTQVPRTVSLVMRKP